MQHSTVTNEEDVEATTTKVDPIETEVAATDADFELEFDREELGAVLSSVHRS